MSHIIIRPVTPDDAAGIVAFWNPIILEGKYTVFTEPFSAEAERTYIESMSDRDMLHVAIDAETNTIVGFQTMSPYSPLPAMRHVSTIGTYIDPSYQRQGIAKKLFAVSFAAAIARGFRKLSTFVRGDNPRALLVYQKQGFTIVGTAKNHALINGQYVDEIMIEKQL
ncbi:MAG: GNAT family N-acetyltransferase [Candidatus Promineifilaceae bacterium]